MDKDEIARLRALCEAATPGPWSQAGTVSNPCPSVHCDHDAGYQIHSMLHQRGEQHYPFMREQYNKDAALIAASRDAIPALLDEVERLRSLVESAYREGWGDGLADADAYYQRGDSLVEPDDAWCASNAKEALR